MPAVQALTRLCFSVPKHSRDLPRRPGRERCASPGQVILQISIRRNLALSRCCREARLATGTGDFTGGRGEPSTTITSAYMRLPRSDRCTVYPGLEPCGFLPRVMSTALPSLRALHMDTFQLPNLTGCSGTAEKSSHDGSRGLRVVSTIRSYKFEVCEARRITVLITFRAAAPEYRRYIKRINRRRTTN